MENKKRVFDESKQIELSEYNLSLGKLVDDKLFIAHHEATTEVQEQSHIEVIETYENGGQDVQTVTDVHYKAAQEAYDEYEGISLYISYTAEELTTIKEQTYKAAIIAKIRVRYSLDDEIALHRQRDNKTVEWKEYNAFCEQCKLEAKVTLKAGQ